VLGAVVVGVAGGGTSLTFFEQATAATHKTAVIRTRVVTFFIAFMSLLVLSLSVETEYAFWNLVV
jgi:hypothetical protein